MNRTKQHIKKFVQQVLGCQCPEEVFQNINWKNKGSVLEINISNRLLINICLKNINDLNKKLIIDLLKTGKKQRDYENFNRFRLVIPIKNNSKIKEKYKILTKIFFPRDDKIHLHIVEKKYLKKLLDKTLTSLNE